MAFAVSDKIIAVARPAKIIRRYLIDVTVTLKLHLTVRRKLKILEGYAFSAFDCGYDFINVITHFFVF